MSFRLRIWGPALGALALIGLLIVVGARRSLPQISGAVRVPGLHGPVTVMRDRWGVPHIYAGDEHDLFVAQGYVTAQDRLWQMLLRRQAARGLLSDWLGMRAASADSVLSRQDFYAQVTSTPADPRADAYALGVNACIANCSDPPELMLLKLQSKKKQIAPWTAVDSAALLRIMLWAQQKNSGTGLRQALSDQVGSAYVSDLLEQGLPTAPALSLDPAARQVLQSVGIPLQAGGDTSPVIIETPPGLPTPWYVVTLHSEHTAVGGATWPGLPDVMVQQLDDIGREARPRRDLVTHLLALPPEGWLQFRVHGMLRQWDGDLSGKTSLSNASAAVYQVWVWHLARDAFQDELGPELFTRYWLTGLAPDALTRLAERPDDPQDTLKGYAGWDDVTTPQREARDDIMRRAYVEALDDLGRHYGDLHTIWEWDTAHAAVFRHPLGDTGPLSWLLNREVKLGGGAPFDPAHPDDPLRPYAPARVSSLRIKQDANGGTMFALAGGQSGNPFSSHYADLLPVWARGASAPLQDAVRPQDWHDVEGVLVLTPG